MMAKLHFRRAFELIGAPNVLRLRVEGKPDVEVHLDSEGELSFLLGQIDALSTAVRTGAKRAEMI